MKKSMVSLGLMGLFLLAVHPVLAQDAQPMAGEDTAVMNQEATDNSATAPTEAPATDTGSQTNTEQSGY